MLIDVKYFIYKNKKTDTTYHDEIFLKYNKVEVDNHCLPETNNEKQRHFRIIVLIEFHENLKKIQVF